jgi:hypothetical protein
MASTLKSYHKNCHDLEYSIMAKMPILFKVTLHPIDSLAEFSIENDWLQ